ncbi:hypothetical protein P7K49_020490 [Saguinus oedipus]|uniref:Uncharacterized protein n=1 Tax=Saguinus oedipus TaxID=9490 RepID=A0ABQ9V0F3_SAGOE|nr:hypothetical protein P7K49_020490 [Saguinus oedipus]
MATLGRAPDSESANLLVGYSAGPAIDWISSHEWVGEFVFTFLFTKFKSPGKELLYQVKLVATKAQMTTVYIIQAHLEQCMDETMKLPSVISDIIEFKRRLKAARDRMGELFEWAGALRHSAMLEIAPRMFPSLATVANFWMKRNNPTFTGFKAPEIIPGSNLSLPLLQMAVQR